LHPQRLQAWESNLIPSYFVIGDDTTHVYENVTFYQAFRALEKFQAFITTQRAKFDFRDVNPVDPQLGETNTIDIDIG